MDDNDEAVIISMLTSSDWRLRDLSLSILVHRKTQHPLLQQHMPRLLTDETLEVRRRALEAAATLSLDLVPLKPVLLNLPSGSDAVSRWWEARVMRRMLPDVDAKSRLSAMLQDSSDMVAAEAALGLVDLGNPASLETFFVEILTHSTSRQARAAAAAGISTFSKSQFPQSDTIKALIDALDDEYYLVILPAIYCLLALKINNEKITDQIRSLLFHRDELVSHGAKFFLQKDLPFN